jgi:beta-galactosidase GanA
MFENHIYNLMMQMVTENKSLWRIKNSYKNDSDCEECKAFWEKLEKDKEEHIKELEALIKKHIK